MSSDTVIAWDRSISGEISEKKIDIDCILEVKPVRIV